MGLRNGRKKKEKKAKKRGGRGGGESASRPRQRDRQRFLPLNFRSEAAKGKGDTGGKKRGGGSAIVSGCLN